MKKILTLLVVLICGQVYGQTFEWAKQMGGNQSDIGYSISTDYFGNIYSTGSYEGPVDFDPGPGVATLLNKGVYILKLDSAGNFLWVRGIENISNIMTSSLKVDVSGSVLFAGYFDGTVDFDPGLSVFNLTSFGPNNTFVEKFDSAGNFIWVVDFKTQYPAFSLDLDSYSNVYLAGTFQGTVDFDPGIATENLTASNLTGFIEKLSSSGNFIWVKALTVIGGGVSRGLSISIDNVNNLYLSGDFNGTVDFNPSSNVYNLTSTGGDIYVMKLNASGNFVWAIQMGGSALGFGGIPASVKADNLGSLVITGQYNTPIDFDPSANAYVLVPNGYEDVFVVKLDTLGNFLWAKSFGGSLNDISTSLTVDIFGDFYLTGFFEGTATFGTNATLSSLGARDVFALKLSSAGSIEWIEKLGGTGFDVGMSLCIENDKLYILGSFQSIIDIDPTSSNYILTSNGQDDIFIQKISQQSSSPSSPLTVSNKIDGNTTFLQPKTLWDGNTTQTPTPIKICADGSKATEIRFVNNTSVSTTAIRFRVASDPSGNDKDISGYCYASDYTINGDTITARFSHPQYLEAAYKPFRADAITIVDTTNLAYPIFTIPIQIYRAPVVFEHGLWGDYSTFLGMKNNFVDNGYYSSELLWADNYKATNASYFYDNKEVVTTAINSLLSTARNFNYSAGKADVVAHSMGGLLARYYLQSDAYFQKKNIHKLITLNTPHFGSQIGNLLSNQDSFVASVAQIAGQIYARSIGSSIYFGAIHDLAVNSSGMDYLNNVRLNNSVAPTHCIITKSPPQFGTYPFLTARAVRPSLGTTLAGVFNHIFFNETNDMVVSTSSQSGGLFSNATNTINNQKHIGSYNNVMVRTEVLNALNTNPKDAAYFAQNGFTPIQQQTHYREGKEGDLSVMIAGSLIFNSPQQGQSFNSGAMLNVNLTLNNGINRIVFAGISSAENQYTVDTLMTSGNIPFIIPADAFGKVSLLAMGYDGNTFVDFDTVTLNINQTAGLDSIICLLDTMRVQVKNIASIPVVAYFDNGYDYTVENSNGVTYEIADTNFSKLFRQDQIWGKQEGLTTLKVNYLGQSINVPLSVIPQDTTIHIDTIITTGIHDPAGLAQASSLTIFPNPTNGNFTIRIDEKFKSEGTIEVFNILGQKIFESKEIPTKNYFTKVLSLQNEIPGLYYLKVRFGDRRYQSKLIISR